MKDDVTVIAEMANAHEGDIATAKELVDAVADPADAIKFQKFTADELFVPSHKDYETFEDLTMASDDWEELIAYTRDAGLAVISDIFGHESLDFMAANDIHGYKAHTADVSNGRLLDRLADLGSPVFLSAGGSTWIELADALDRLEGVPTTLMYGYQNYPTAVEEANLYRLQALRSKFETPVGYAPHAPGDADVAVTLPRLAVAAGASAVEVHITLDRSQEGTDHYSALEPDEFTSMVTAVREAEPLVGDRTLSLTPGEKEYRNEHKKWLVATEPIAKGETISGECIGYRRLEVPPISRNLSEETVTGKTATEDLSTGDAITLANMDTRVVATLACRSESTRLYGKPLQMVGEKPIIGHLVSRLQDVDAIDDIVLAIADTPSKESFKQYAREQDLEYVIGSEENVLGRLVQTARAGDADIVVRVTTENPYIYTENIDELISIHRQHNCHLTLTEDLPLGTTVEVVSRGALEKAQEHGDDRHRSELCTLFIVENAESFEIKTVEPPTDLRRPDIRLTVDNPEDLVVVREIWKNLADGTTRFSLQDIVEFLDANPDLTDLQSHLPDGTDEAIKQHRPFMYGDR